MRAFVQQQLLLLSANMGNIVVKYRLVIDLTTQIKFD